MTDLASFMLPVAKILWGDPRPGATKTEVRFGDGQTVNPVKGTWFSFADEKGGGVLDLIKRETGREGAAAFAWLRENGFPVEDRPARQNGAEPRREERPKAPTPKPAASAPAPTHPEPEWKIARTYDYLDEGGNLVFQVVRMENGTIDDVTGKPRKTFRQRRPDPSRRDGWNWSVAGVRQVPYRMGEVLEAIAQGLVVFVVEGEKAADRLADLGVPATCNAGGAGKWPPGFEEIFAGADVVVLPDNDPQARKQDGSPRFHEDGRPVHPGQDHAELVARALLPVASSVRVLDLPGLPPKGDVDDWIEAGGTADVLYELVETAVPAEEWVEARPWVVAPPIEPKPFVSRFRAVPWANLDDPAEEHSWLVKGWITEGERSVVAGESQSGKSFLVLDMAMAIARGEPWWGARTRKGGVIYLAGEGAKGFRKRLRAYRQANGLSLEDPMDFVLLASPIDLYGSDDQTNALIDEARHWSRSFSEPLRLLVIDTLAASIPGANENASEDMSRVLGRCARISEVLKCAVLLVHHLNAGNSKVRGHTSILANIDSVIVVTKREDRHDEIEITDPRTGDLRTIKRPIREATLKKQKDGEDGAKIEFVLAVERIGRDEDGDPITSCIIVPPGETSESRRPQGYRARGLQAPFVRALYDALDAGGYPPPADLGLDLSVRLVADWADVRERFRAMLADDDREGEKFKGRTRDVFNRLMIEGVVGRNFPHVWWTGRPVVNVPRHPKPIRADETPAPAVPPVDDEDPF